MKAPDTKIAVTLYNLREYCKTKEDLDKTLGRVKSIGYEAVQVSGLGPIAPEDVKELLDKHNLYVCATHEGYPGLIDNFDNIVKKMKLWDCNFTAVGSPGPMFDWTKEGVPNFLKTLSDTGKKFAAEGLMFGFHNHHQEFTRYGEKTLLDQMYDEISPDILKAEIDVHWIQRGGGNPVKWIYKVAGRMPVIHFKDYTIIEKEPHFCEIGEGSLDWPEIIKACEDTGVRWYSIEQDKEIPNRNIFDSIEISFKNLKKFGVK